MACAGKGGVSKVFFFDARVQFCHWLHTGSAHLRQYRCSALLSVYESLLCGLRNRKDTG